MYKINEGGRVQKVPNQKLTKKVTAYDLVTF